MMTPEKTNLDHISIVLNRPKHPENIGSAARALKNMGLKHLMVVDPEKYHKETILKLATHAASDVVEQIIRPTGLIDPKVEVVPTKGQIDDLLKEIRAHTKAKERVLVTTLTKKSSEQMADYLAEQGIKVRYLHSEIETMERIEILRDLRLGKFDVLVGINLLREGLDLPEVAFIGILDADKEGFLRSSQALIQTIGRCARNVNGHVKMYADRITDSMKKALSETERRRKIQIAYNKKHGITPESIVKAVQDITIGKKTEEKHYERAKVPREEVKHLIQTLEDQMDLASMNLEFEKAADLRDEVEMIRQEYGM